MAKGQGFIGKLTSAEERREKFSSELRGKRTLDQLLYNLYLSQKNCRRYKAAKAPESVLRAVQDSHQEALEKVRARLKEIRQAVNS